MALENISKKLIKKSPTNLFWQDTLFAPIFKIKMKIIYFR